MGPAAIQANNTEKYAQFTLERPAMLKDIISAWNKAVAEAPLRSDLIDENTKVGEPTITVLDKVNPTKLPESGGAVKVLSIVIVSILMIAAAVLVLFTYQKYGRKRY